MELVETRHHSKLTKADAVINDLFKGKISDLKLVV